MNGQSELLKSLKARIEQKKLHENKVVFEVSNQNIQNKDEEEMKQK